MIQDITYWVWLSRLQGIGIKKLEKLLQIYQTPEQIWKVSKKELQQIKIIGEKTAEIILDKQYRQGLQQYIDYMERYQIELVTKMDCHYPKELKHIYDAPLWLYIQGNKEILNQPSLAVIGCRDCSQYGKEVAKNLSYELAKKEIGIISGMAKGIDTYAHLGCLEAQGKTIAILGSGLDRIYPKENKRLISSNSTKWRCHCIRICNGNTSY